MDEAVSVLVNGGVAVVATDTIYGVVAKAADVDAVERIYQLKSRNEKKPLIILISDINQVEDFGVVLDDALKNQLHNYWPGPVSIILPVSSGSAEYLHRGHESLAFRLPAKSELVSLIEQTGPLVAPSANPEGEKPSSSIAEAKEYFGDSVDAYIDEGIINSRPSKLVSFVSGSAKTLRS